MVSEALFFCGLWRDTLFGENSAPNRIVTLVARTLISLSKTSSGFSIERASSHRALVLVDPGVSVDHLEKWRRWLQRCECRHCE